MGKLTIITTSERSQTIYTTSDDPFTSNSKMWKAAASERHRSVVAEEAKGLNRGGKQASEGQEELWGAVCRFTHVTVEMGLRLCTYIKTIEPYTLNMCGLLYVNDASVKLLKSKLPCLQEEFLEFGSLDLCAWI